MDSERRDELFDLMSNLDFDYEIIQIDWWEDQGQWTVLLNNYQNLDLETIIGDLSGSIERCHLISDFRFVDGYFDIEEMESTGEFDSKIFENIETFLERNEISENLQSLNKLTVRSFSLTFSS